MKIKILLNFHGKYSNTFFHEIDSFDFTSFLVWTFLNFLICLPFFPGKTDNVAKSMFDEAATDVENELVQTSNSGMTYFAEQKFGRLEHKMDHLACFGGKDVYIYRYTYFLNSCVMLMRNPPNSC